MRLPGLGNIFFIKFQKRLNDHRVIGDNAPRQVTLSQKRRVTKFGENRLGLTLVITLYRAQNLEMIKSLNFSQDISFVGLLKFLHFVSRALV